MKLNFFQQIGIVAAVIGLILLGIYTQSSRPEFNVGGGVITFRDIPEWLPGGTLFSGLGLLILGTGWNVIARRRGDGDEADEERPSNE